MHKMVSLKTHLLRSLVLLCGMFCFVGVHAQNKGILLSGSVNETVEKKPVSGAVLLLFNAQDTIPVHATSSDSTGHFELNAPSSGDFRIVTLMSGFAPDTTALSVQQPVPDLAILLEVSATFLREVNIAETIARMEIRGDTVQFNAAAFQVNPDASAEDLLKKMPGMTVEGTTVKTGGEEVKKVVVDGKPFFGDDPATTLRNLPADMIESMQVYDMQTDQATFGGYKDGNAEKTINIKTKKNRKNGSFGKVYAGGGTAETYQTGFNLNTFKGERRFSLIGMSNNINQQNFSTQDIMGMMSDGQGRQGGRGGGRMMSAFSGQQAGISRTHAGGVNYNDTWNEKITVSGNYFVNEGRNTNNSNTIRNYFSSDEQRYEETGNSSGLNLNHKGFLRMEYKPDTVNRIVLSTRLTTQDYSSNNYTGGTTSFLPSDSAAINTANSTTSGGKAFNASGDLLFQHRFARAKRTITATLNAQINNRTGSGDYFNKSIYYLNNDSTAEINQRYSSVTNSLTIAPSLSFTEPMGINDMLVINIKPSFQQNYTTRLTDDVTQGIADYAPLSNKYNFQYNKQAGGIAYQYYTKSIEISAGADVEQSRLYGNQTFPAPDTTDRIFNNLLPRFSFVKRFESKSSLNLNINSYTQSPSATQLQDVLDISNPLFVRSGNSALQQSRDNSFDIRFNKRIPDSEKNFMFSLNGTNTVDYIGNASNILRNDTTIRGIDVARGAQITRPENLGDYYTLRFFGMFGVPLTKLKVNLNFNGGYTFSHTPAKMNGVLYYNDNHATNGGLSASSNISPELDFTVSGNLSYNQVINNQNSSGDNTYITQNVSGRINWIIKERLVWSSDISFNNYLGLSQSDRQRYALWNASVGYKFGASKGFEVKANCFDILKENISLNRNVNANFTEDVSTQTLQRYGMVTLTYTFRKFNGKSEQIGNDKPKGAPMPWH